MNFETPVLIALIIAAALVVGLAVWLGRGLILRKDSEGFSVEVKESQSKKEAGKNGISVAEKAVIENASVGDVAGIKVQGRSRTRNADQPIEVAHKLKIKGSQVGDIAGIKEERDRPKARE